MVKSTVFVIIVKFKRMMGNQQSDPMHIKHLEFIQNVITRHNTNSLMIKGWAITITAALLALAGSAKEPYVALVSILPIVLFWWLDSLFLANERSYISLYNCALNGYKLEVEVGDLTTIYRKQKNIDDSTHDIDKFNIESELLSMDLEIFKVIKRNNISATFCSNTIKYFYLSLLFVTICSSIVLFYSNNNIVNPTQIDAHVKIDSIPANTIDNHIFIPDTISVKLKKSK